jgi:hypothetical protein
MALDRKFGNQIGDIYSEHRPGESRLHSGFSAHVLIFLKFGTEKLSHAKLQVDLVQMAKGSKIWRYFESKVIWLLLFILVFVNTNICVKHLKGVRWQERASTLATVSMMIFKTIFKGEEKRKEKKTPITLDLCRLKPFEISTSDTWGVI